MPARMFCRSLSCIGGVVAGSAVGAVLVVKLVVVGAASVVTALLVVTVVAGVVGAVVTGAAVEVLDSEAPEPGRLLPLPLPDPGSPLRPPVK